MNIEDYEKFHKKGGEYVIPIEVFNEIIEEIERLNKELQDTKEHLGEYLHEQEEENKRLNNIINELEKDVKIKIDFYKQEIKEFQDDLFTSNYEEIEDAKNEIKIRRCHIIELEDTLDKIEELKEKNNEKRNTNISKTNSKSNR